MEQEQATPPWTTHQATGQGQPLDKQQRTTPQPTRKEPIVAKP